jgi:hypothetical protein
LLSAVSVGVLVVTSGCSNGSSHGTSTDGSGAEETLAPASTDDEATTVSADGAASGTTATAASTDVDFEAAVEAVAECGRTCPTLTYAIQNQGTDRTPDVTVGIRVFTGRKKVWDEDQNVGTIAARSRRTGITRDIDVGLLDGQQIESNDGEVTIELTAEAAGSSETFEFQRTLDV